MTTIQDGQEPVHAIILKSTTGDVVLQQGQVILDEAGIEKVGTFSHYDPELHDRVPCPWAEPIPLKGCSVVALRQDGVFKLAGWSDHVCAIVS